MLSHYPVGKHNKAWRRAKPLKKAKARRAFRKASNDLLRVCGAEPEAAPESARRKQRSVEPRRVVDWGPLSMPGFVASRRVRQRLTVGDKQASQAQRAGA